MDSEDIKEYAKEAVKWAVKNPRDAAMVAVVLLAVLEILSTMW